jgi:hypothetical protein
MRSESIFYYQINPLLKQGNNKNTIVFVTTLDKIFEKKVVLCFRLHHITIVFVTTRDKIFENKKLEGRSYWHAIFHIPSMSTTTTQEGTF